jgi:hypothetical protein
VSRPDRSGADQIDAEHQATDLAVRRSVLILESEMKRRAFLASLPSLVGAAASNGPAPRRVTPPSPGHLQLHPGSPPTGAVDDRVLWDVTREQPSAAFLVAPRRSWPGERLWSGRSCWLLGLRSLERSGCGGVPACWRRTAPTASGAAADRGCHSSRCRPADLTTFGWAGSTGAGRRRCQQAGGPGAGVVRDGDPPLEPVPVEVGDRFPVNFYAGFYQQPRRDERPCTWQVIRVLGFDKGLRQ